jgi:Flp pilus assembly protein TadD
MTRAEGAIGLALLRGGRPAEAEVRLKRAVAAHPDSAPYFYQLGVALLAQRRFGEAEYALRRAIVLRPDMAEPRLALADTYLALGDRAQAREQYDEARRLSPLLAARLAGAFAAGP